MSEIDADRIDAAGTEWLRLQQAADYLGVNERTVRNWVKAGDRDA